MLLLFLSFKHFKAKRVNPQERGNMGEQLDNLNKMAWLFPWYVLFNLVASGIIQEDGSPLSFVTVVLSCVLYKNYIHVCSAM